MATLTLQNRITSLMVISSVLFISVFTFIQVNNSASSINHFNTYKAGLSSNIVNNSLEAVIRQAQPSETGKFLQSSIDELKDADIIKEAVVFDPEGKIVASTDDSQKGGQVSFADLRQVQTLTNDNWLSPYIDRERGVIYMYLALHADPNKDDFTYAAKLFFHLSNMQEALISVYQPIILTALIIILANFILAFILSKTVIGPIKVLNEVTKAIAAGDLTIRAKIQTNDELQELGQTFNHMTEELIKMKERAENANPLTKLPGNIVIHEQVEKRIQENRKFTVIYCDLDNFKAFNDKYGIAKGDEAIKLTAKLFRESIKEKGNAEDFIGHEGGDDFLLITTPDKAQGVADYITQEFDKHVRSLYSPEDLTQGFIIAHTRDNSIKQFPIMTISLAGISNETRTIHGYAEVTNIAAEVKKKAKAVEGSVFILDKRSA